MVELDEGVDDAIARLGTDRMDLKKPRRAPFDFNTQRGSEFNNA